jgi:aspartyl-tRNA(Asn)/glutamyl-tRNA(Gln) amidotransferase subunit A
MAGLDGLVTPTNDKVAMAIADLAAPDPATGRTYMDQMGRNTYSANILGLCATTTPVQSFGSSLPVGLQIMCEGFAESRALSIALLMEDLFGPPPRPELSGFAK